MKSRFLRMRLSLMVLFIMLLAGTVTTSAQQKQKFSVASFELDQFDLTAQNDQHKKVDGNGSLYAIIKVTSNNPNDKLSEYRFNFGNMNHEVVNRDGELWVYVQRNAKFVTISRQDYTTINKYDLGLTIEEGRTYTMQLSATATPVYRQMVQFAIEPANAKAVVMVKGPAKDVSEELFGNVDETGGVAKTLPYGTYTYRVMAENYHSSQGSFTLADRSKNHIEKVVLRPNFAEVTLQVEGNADIFVNGEKKGTHTWKGILQAGNYQIECHQENHRSSSQSIDIEENVARTYQLIAPTPITGTLALTSKPLGANIRIDGKDYGVTPKSIDGLLIGRHTVMLSKQNYNSESKFVEIEENQITDAEIVLNREKVVAPVNTRYTTPAKKSSNEKKKNNFYIQAFYQPTTFSGAGAAAGVYLNRFNLEGLFIYGFAESDPVLWNVPFGENSIAEISCCYRPMSFMGKVGYSVINNEPFRMTLQLGLGDLSISNTGSEKSDGYAFVGSAGAKVDYSFSKNFALFVTLEGLFQLSKSDNFGTICDMSDQIKRWSSGFNAQIGVCVFF